MALGYWVNKINEVQNRSDKYGPAKITSPVYQAAVIFANHARPKTYTKTGPAKNKAILCLPGTVP